MAAPPDAGPGITGSGPTLRIPFGRRKGAVASRWSQGICRVLDARAALKPPVRSADLLVAPAACLHELRGSRRRHAMARTLQASTTMATGSIVCEPATPTAGAVIAPAVNRVKPRTALAVPAYWG